MNQRSPALLRLARGQSCVNCGADDETIVAAHSNVAEHGKGKSLKAHDIFSAHLCFKCHRFYDEGQSDNAGRDPTGVWTNSPDDRRMMFRKAMDATMLRLWQQGKVKVA